MIKALGKKAVMAMHQQLSHAIKYWAHIAPVVKYPKNNKEYKILVAQLDELLEIVGSNEQHALMGLVDALSYLISVYEEKNFKVPKISAVEVLKFLMVEHELSQKDLPEIASQGVLSEILNNKRTLNVRQIKLLAKRFGVSPATFIDED